MCPFLEKLVKRKGADVTQFPWLTTHDKTMVFLFNYCKLLNFLTAGGLDVGMQGPRRACSLLGHKQSLLTMQTIYFHPPGSLIFHSLESICFWHTLLWSLFNHDPVSLVSSPDQRHLREIRHWDDTVFSPASLRFASKSSSLSLFFNPWSDSTKNRKSGS